jgi:hypothetical protein
MSLNCSFYDPTSLGPKWCNDCLVFLLRISMVFAFVWGSLLLCGVLEVF